MLYISVDNDYHGNLALSLIKKYGLMLEDVVFISHISPRNNIIPASQFRRKVVAGHPLSNGSGYKRPISYIRSVLHQRKLASMFSFTGKDVLVVITEYQLNNAILAQKVKKAGGSVYLFDEGIGFYLNNSPYHKGQATLKDRLLLLLYDLAHTVLGIPVYARKGFAARMYVCIKDKYIDRIYSSMRLPIDRRLEVCGYRNVLTSGEAVKKKNENLVILFASNFDCFGLKDEELVLIGEAVKRLAGEFSEVYIKIHPSDWIAKNEIFSFYQKLIDSHPNLRLVDNSLTGNEAIELYRPRVVVGMMSTALFDALLLGCQPVFLFHLLPEVPGFGVCKFTLENIGYRYISSLSDISQHYDCDVDIAAFLYDQECEIWWESSSAL
jgi:hypothetical protein